MKSIKLFSVLCLLAGTTLFFMPLGCKKVDDAVNDYFTGMFASPDGWEMEITNNGNGIYDGVIRKVGTGRTASGRVVGDKIFMNANKTSDNSLSGSVRWEDLTMYDPGTITISGSTLTITPNGRTSYSFTKTGASSGSGSSGSGSGGSGSGGTGSGGDTILKQSISADGGKGQTLSFKIPAETKSMTVTTFESNTYERNNGDLFINFNSAPQITFVNGLTPTYEWNNITDKSMNINRGNEICTVTSPTEGTWYATGFNPNIGYVFSCTIAVIIYK